MDLGQDVADGDLKIAFKPERRHTLFISQLPDNVSPPRRGRPGNPCSARKGCEYVRRTRRRLIPPGEPPPLLRNPPRSTLNPASEASLRRRHAGCRDGHPPLP